MTGWKSFERHWGTSRRGLEWGGKPEEHHAGVLHLHGPLHQPRSINRAEYTRIYITANMVTIQRDLPGQKPDHKARGVEFVKFDPGTWHKVRLEMVGDTMLGRLVAWGTDACFKQAHTEGFTVKGQSVEMRNFKLSEAALNPEWDQMKMKITPTLNMDKKAAMVGMDLKIAIKSGFMPSIAIQAKPAFIWLRAKMTGTSRRSTWDIPLKDSYGAVFDRFDQLD